MASLLETELSMSRVYSTILSVFPYSLTSFVYTRLHALIPVSWTGEVTTVSVKKLLDVFTQIVPQKEMDTFLPRLVEQLATIHRVGRFDELEPLVKRATLRIAIPPDSESESRSESDTESESSDGYVPRVCYCS
jgi:hypothetical protein